MKEKTIDRLMDKGTDVLVVIMGILIALSIESCREDHKSKAQWQMFADQFLKEAEIQEESLPGIISFYEKRAADTKNLLKKINEGKVTHKEINDQLKAMTELQVDFPNQVLFNAFVQTGNPYFINDTKKVRLLGQYYYFEKIAMSQVDFFKNQFMPELMTFIKKFNKHPKDLSPIKEEASFVFVMYLRMMEGNIHHYKRQNKFRLQVIESLRQKD